MSGLVERLGLDSPVVQAGMGPVAGHALAAAVSEAGGLGTLGLASPGTLERELRLARDLTGAPLAVNLLLPFARDAHWRVAEEADVVFTFWGVPRRRTGKVWIHQCGSPEEALAAHEAGADAVIAQGVEAGGHVRGQASAPDLLERVRVALPAGYPVLAAGAIADAGDVRNVLEAGADAAVLGTRFLLSEESAAHPGYKRRVLDARETLLTELFGLGWPAPHRVVPNAATERWLGGDRRGPSWLRAVNRLTEPLAARLPVDSGAIGVLQRSGLPLYSPRPPLAGMPDRTLDAAPLYAGEAALRMLTVQPAAEIVRSLA